MLLVAGCQGHPREGDVYEHKTVVNRTTGQRERVVVVDRGTVGALHARTRDEESPPFIVDSARVPLDADAVLVAFDFREPPQLIIDLRTLAGEYRRVE